MPPSSPPPHSRARRTLRSADVVDGPRPRPTRSRYLWWPPVGRSQRLEHLGRRFPWLEPPRKPRFLRSFPIAPEPGSRGLVVQGGRLVPSPRCWTGSFMGSPADTVRRLASFKSRRPQGSDASYWTLPLTHGWDEGRGAAEERNKGVRPKALHGNQKEDRVGSNRFCFQIPVETKFVKDLKLSPSQPTSHTEDPTVQIGCGGSLSQSRLPTPTPKAWQVQAGLPEGAGVSVERQLLRKSSHPPFPSPMSKLSVCV